MRAGVLVLVAAMLAARPAAAQEPVNLRELLAENQRLTEEIRESRAQIAALAAEVSALKNERRGLLSRVRDAESVLGSLRRELGAADVRRQGTEAERLAVPDDALASPTSLFRELQNRYYEATRDLPDSTAADRELFEQQVALWCRLVNRELRGRRTWLVELEDAIPIRGGRAIARLTVFDESTGLAIDEPVDVEVPRRFADRIDDPRYERWLLTAVVIAAPRYNEDRFTQGVFEFPPFIGPLADFDFDLDWIALRGLREGEPPVATDEPGAADAGAAETQEAQPTGDRSTTTE